MGRKCLRPANNEQYYFALLWSNVGCNPTPLSDMTPTRNSAFQMFLLAIRRWNKVAYFSIGVVKKNFSQFF